MSHAFNPFTGLNPVLYNPYTKPLWDAAVVQFNRALAPAEQKVADVLKKRLQNAKRNLQQVRRK